MVDYSNIPRDSRRVPLETRVQFKFDRFDGFISEYSANISPGGMYLRTRAPQPPGTVLDFAFRLGDGFELIRGRGEVVWNRMEDEGPARPAGMGLRFIELSEGSKELIYRIVDQHILQGGIPFDVTQGPPDPVPVPVPVPSPFDMDAPWPRPAPPPSQDVFELPPPPPPIGVSREAREPEPLSSWLPPLDEPAPAGPEPFPDLLPAAPPEEAPVESPPMFATAFGAASRRPPGRKLPWVLLAAGVLLAASLFLLRDQLMGWIGLGGEEEVAQATPAPRPKKPRAPMAPMAPRAAPSEAASAAVPSPSAEPPAAAAPAPATTAPTVTPPAVGSGSAPAPAAPTPAPAAAPIVAPPAAASKPVPIPAIAEDDSPALTKVDKITFEAAGGGTDVILWANGSIPASVYSQTRIDGNPPRALFRITGVREPFATTRVVAGTPELLQVRTGFHAGSRGGHELHVVLDLAHPNVAVTQVESGPKRLRIHLQRK